MQIKKPIWKSEINSEIRNQSSEIRNQVRNHGDFESRRQFEGVGPLASHPPSTVPPSPHRPTLPPPSHPVGMLVVLTTPVKNYPKWQAIQLAIHSTVGA